ncbi:MAG: tetratricopeptide repeat protein, partial [Candidatus Neomarinimicrobiota bacterium]
LGGLSQSIRHFEQAIAIDPGFALPYAGLADAFIALGSYSYRTPREMLPQAGTLARKALALDSTMAEAHTALAEVQFNYDWDLVAAERSFQRAIALKPGYRKAYDWYAQLLVATGREVEGIKTSVDAVPLNPLDTETYGSLALVYYFAHQYDQAIEHCRKALELDEAYFTAHVYLGLAYAQKGMFGKAIPPLEAAVQLSGGSALVKSSLGYAYGLAGRDREARELLNELRAAAETQYVPAISMAAIHMGLGERDAVFKWLDKAYKERHHYLIFSKVEPMMDGLRSDPRFQALLAKMNLD